MWENKVFPYYIIPASKITITGGIREPPFGNYSHYNWQGKNHQWLLIVLLDESTVNNRTLPSFKASSHNALIHFRHDIYNLLWRNPADATLNMWPNEHHQ